MPQRHVETVLEAGLALVGALLLGGLGVLIAGHLGGLRQRGAGEAEQAPVSGSVSPLRHQQIGASSPR